MNTISTDTVPRDTSGLYTGGALGFHNNYALFSWFLRDLEALRPCGSVACTCTHTYKGKLSVRFPAPEKKSCICNPAVYCVHVL
jgi:hypothetical protein